MKEITELSPKPPKHHFEILDGLRGIAALVILVFHFMEIIYPDSSLNFIGHGFLAVDFFFSLSGFVMAYAYDEDRMKHLGMKEFFKLRLIRLHPLVLLGSILGLVGLLFDPWGRHILELYSSKKLFWMFISSTLVVPFPIMSERLFNLIPLNAPAWSLFWEYVANIIYGSILYRITKRWLYVLTTVAACILCVVCERAGGSLLGGWSKGTFWDGGARISYSFLVGMLIYRSNWIFKNNNKLGFMGMSVLLLFSFIIPCSTNWNWIIEPLIVLFYYPCLISLGAGASIETPQLRKICLFLGQISYPLYMTHYSVMWMFLNYCAKYKPDAFHLVFIVFTGSILLIGFAYVVMVVYDIPMRTYLSVKRQQQSVPENRELLNLPV